MIERTINFTISIETNDKIKKYARYTNLKNPTCIRFFISEQIVYYMQNTDSFMQQWNKRRYKRVNNDEVTGMHNIDYSFKISSEMYEKLQSMQNELEVPLNELVANLIQNELENIFVDYERTFSTSLKNIETEDYRSNIHWSNVVRQELQNVADMMGISLNALISHILMKYLIEHYNDFYDDVYVDNENNTYTSQW